MATYPDRTVWYSWTAPESGTASFNTGDANFDTVLAAYTGTAITGLTLKASNHNINGTLQSRMTFAATAGTQYRIVVDGWGGATGSIGLQWTIAAPANDDFASATALTGTYYGTKNGTTIRSTGEPGEPVIPRFRDRRKLGVVHVDTGPQRAVEAAPAQRRGRSEPRGGGVHGQRHQRADRGRRWHRRRSR